MFSPPIQALSFDAAGTLIHLAEPVGSSYSRVASQFGMESEPTAMESAFRSVWQRTPPAFSESPNRRHETEKDWWHDLVREVFQAAGAIPSDDETFAACFEALYELFELPGTWLAAPETGRILEQISARYPCVVLSNFDTRLRRILHDLDLADHFERFFLSCEIGASKPDPRIFDAARTYFQCPSGSILHVGDDPFCDGEGAAKAGFQHFRVEAASSGLSRLLEELSLA